MDTPHNAIPTPEVAVQVAIRHLNGNILHVEDGRVRVSLPTLDSLTPEQRDYIQTRRDLRAKHAARLSILRQASATLSGSQFSDPEDD